MSGETEQETSGWTVDTINYYFQKQLDDQQTLFETQISNMRSMLDERYATQTKAVDAAFLAQQTAMKTAQEAQQTAMRTALEAAEKAVATALQSAEKAVNKAEVASDKRFESVNEFRGQLQDQATRFVSKDEYGATQQRFDERVTDIQRRLDKSEGKGAGYAALYGWAAGAIAIIISIVVMANALLGK